MKYWKNLLLTNILFVVSFANATNNVEVFNRNNYNNLFVLGDSLSDTGAFVQYHGQFYNKAVINPQCFSDDDIWQPSFRNRKCYKIIKLWKSKSFALPFYQNSFSNGPVAVQNVANLLKIKNFKSASYSNGEFDNFGYNYATGSAKILTSNELFWLEIVAHLESNVLQSNRYNLIQQVNMLKHHHKIINQNDLLIVNIGSNDVLEVIRALTYLEIDIWKPTFFKRLENIISTLFSQVIDLINYGFNRIIIGNIPDLSKTPRFNNDVDKKSIASMIVAEYNEKFSLKFNNLIKDIRYAKKIRKFDLNLTFDQILKTYELANKVINQPAVDINWTTSFFFKDSFSAYYLDDVDSNSVDNYVFFDDIHPTGLVHHRIGEKLYEIANNLWVYE